MRPTAIDIGWRRSRDWLCDESQRLRRNALLALLLLAILPSDGLGIEVCPFHLFSGYICPACGLSRSISSLLHGQWWQSFLYHPLGLVAAAWLVSVAATNRNPVSYVPDYARMPSRLSLVVGVLIVLAVWVARLTVTPHLLGGDLGI